MCFDISPFMAVYWASEPGSTLPRGHATARALAKMSPAVREKILRSAGKYEAAIRSLLKKLLAAKEQPAEAGQSPAPG